MDNPINNQNEDEYSTIFSKIDESQKTKRYSFLQNDLSKLQQSVYLLSFYGTKGKLNTKKIKKKVIPSPKATQTEPNYKSKGSRKLVKSKDYIIDNNNTKNKNIINKINNLKQIKQINKNHLIKTASSNKSFKGKLFMTNINYKNTNPNISLNNTNYNSNKNIFNNSKYSKLPYLDTNNSFIKTKIDNTNNTSINKTSSNKKNNNISLNKEEFPKITNYMIKNIKKENNNIKNKIYKGIDKFNLMEWYMKTRFKYAEYKYGIAEIQKYFMDLKAYGKPEEEEIEKRKTFYEHVEDVINELHEDQKEKEFEKLNKKYGVEHDKKKIIKSKKENKNNENPEKKQRNEISKALHEIVLRRKKEKQRRSQIEDILFKCKQRVHSINCFDKKLQKKERKSNV